MPAAEALRHNNSKGLPFNAERSYPNIRSVRPFIISIRPNWWASTSAVGDASTTRATRSSADRRGHEPIYVIGAAASGSDVITILQRSKLVANARTACLGVRSGETAQWAAKVSVEQGGLSSRMIPRALRWHLALRSAKELNQTRLEPDNSGAGGIG